MENGLVKREVMMEIIGCLILIMAASIRCVHDSKGENIRADFLFSCPAKASARHNNTKMVHDPPTDIDRRELDLC